MATSFVIIPTAVKRKTAGNSIARGVFLPRKIQFHREMSDPLISRFEARRRASLGFTDDALELFSLSFSLPLSSSLSFFIFPVASPKGERDKEASFGAKEKRRAACNSGH